ncbi:hypothetical protein KDA11_05225 [Candidatus Saccharibacteria bacterium]|nr:hypothetical protein [Candidatus Saccharibacteria bacterium]
MHTEIPISDDQIIERLQNRVEYEQNLRQLKDWSDDWHNWEGTTHTTPLLSLSIIRSYYDNLIELDTINQKRNDDELFNIANLYDNQMPINFSHYPVITSPACSSAEWRFYSMLKKVNQQTDDEHRLITVYYDDRQPVFIQKNRGSLTALNLVPLRIAGCYVPTGTIVEISSSVSSVINARHKYVDGSQYISMPLYDVGISPIRISSWAYQDPLDRALFACQKQSDDQIEINHQTLQKVTSVDIEDFRQAAKVVMSFTGVTR